MGVVGAITPWNQPAQVNMAKVAPALAAGNAVILKAAPTTPWARRRSASSSSSTPRSRPASST